MPKPKIKVIKFVLPFILVFMLINRAFSIYVTPGDGRIWNLDSLVANSSGHISFSNGNYYINDTLQISASDTIKITQNATINMMLKGYIYCLGVFIINPPDSVKITAADTANKYIGIKLDSTSGASVFKRLIMEHSNCINLMYCDMLIDSCIIRYNDYYVSGLKSGAISLYRSNVVVSHCKIFRNRRAAIVSGANIPSSPTITDNLIYENDTENGLYPQINLGVGASTPIIIRNNDIRGLYPNSGGIGILPASTSITNLIIENNAIKKNSYGIVLYNTNINAYISDNIIDSNNININPMTAGSGINLYGASSINAVITRNKIRWNLWGVTVQMSAKPNLGNLNNTDTSDNGYNYIYYNTHNDSTFDVCNNTHDSIKAQNNFWGTTNIDTIQSHILDHFDADTLGVIDFLPIIISKVNQISSSSAKNYRLFDAYPNPFNPKTIIKFQIPDEEKNYMVNVQLKIYDILGKEIATLVNSKLQPGIYEVPFSINQNSNYQLPSGIYFYKLTSGTFSEAKKLMLIK
jgi:hypothetical protein